MAQHLPKSRYHPTYDKCQQKSPTRGIFYALFYIYVGVDIFGRFIELMTQCREWHTFDASATTSRT
jgi:hypothetical protein